MAAARKSLKDIASDPVAQEVLQEAKAVELEKLAKLHTQGVLTDDDVAPALADDSPALARAVGPATGR